VSLAYDAPIQGPRHRTQRAAEPGPRAALTVAEALRARFPLRPEPAQERRAVSVAEALRCRFPPLARTPASTGPTRPALPRRVRGISLSAAARQAEPSASPELLRRILDGLQRL
jgi:hypothetical protein